jgi:hypothetical protein
VLKLLCPDGIEVLIMAIRVTFHLVDDLDGTASPDVTKVAFGLDGQRYEIDLSTVNAERLRVRLAEFVRVARRTGESPVSPPTLADLRRTSVANGVAPTSNEVIAHQPASLEWQLDDRKSA